MTVKIKISIIIEDIKNQFIGKIWGIKKHLFLVMKEWHSFVIY